MSHVIRICSEAGVTTSICGQAPSNYPEVVEFLVREGAVSMSVNPDKVIETKQLVAGIDQKLILEGMRRMRVSNGHNPGVLPPRWPKKPQIFYDLFDDSPQNYSRRSKILVVRV